MPFYSVLAALPFSTSFPIPCFTLNSKLIITLLPPSFIHDTVVMNAVVGSYSCSDNEITFDCHAVEDVQGIGNLTVHSPRFSIIVPDYAVIADDNDIIYVVPAHAIETLANRGI